MSIDAKPQVSVYDVMKNWCDLQQRGQDDHERVYCYYFDDETGITYRLTNLYNSSIISHNYPDYQEVELSFNYDDKKEVLYPSNDKINAFFEIYINASNIPNDENNKCKI